MTSIFSHADRCPICGKPAELKTFTAPQGEVGAFVYTCNCKQHNKAKEQQEKDKAQLFAEAGVDTSATKRCEPAPIISKIYQEGKGCFLYGSTGAGKTTMLDAIAYRIIAGNVYEAGGRINCKKRVRMVGAVELFESLRGYGSDAARQRLEDLKTCDWLLIDDLGQERSSEWVVERLYELLDARYRLNAITCASSNYTMADLGRKWAANDDLKARVMIRRLGFLTYQHDMNTPQQQQIAF